MTEEVRTGPFWDMLAGRRPPPASAVLLGWTLVSLDAEAGRIKLRFTATEAFLNPVGTVQGGFLTAMLDDAMGPAAVAYLGGAQFAQTLELKTCFLRPGRVGHIFAEGWVAHRGRDILFLEGILRDPEDQPIATATATARVIAFGPRTETPQR